MHHARIGKCVHLGCGRPCFHARIHGALVELSGASVRPAAGVVTGAPVRLRGRRVLLVDDEAMNRKLAEFLLTKLDLVVTQASNGVEATALLAEQPFDVVLMDCQMPEMDGYETTRRLRRSGTQALNRRVPVIALTAHALSGERERCMAAGMDDYLTKPMNAARLASVLQALFAERLP